MTTTADRVSMALAEAGYPGAINPAGSVHPFQPEQEDSWIDIVPAVPARIAWRAFVVAGVPYTACFACWLPEAASPPDCLAPGLGIEDCGRDRGEP